jgi:hypothetical protein
VEALREIPTGELHFANRGLKVLQIKETDAVPALANNMAAVGQIQPMRRFSDTLRTHLQV